VAAHRQVEAPQSVARQGIASTLQNHSLGLIVFHDIVDDGLEDGLVGMVVDTVA
jgi:hypothetical protein